MDRRSNPSRSLRRHAEGANWLLRLVDAGLVGILFVVPLFMGGRHPTGRLVFVGLAVVTAVAWLVAQCFAQQNLWQRSAATWIVLAGIGLLVLQLIPLPPGALATLSPDLDQILPLWHAQADVTPAMGPWTHISLTPAETRGGLVMFLAYSLVFLVTLQRVGDMQAARRILIWLSLATIMMAAFGIVQYLTTNGKFVWLYEHPFRTVRGVQGSFINRNHFAHLLALGIGPLAYCLVTSLRDRATPSGAGFKGSNRGDDLRALAPTAWMIGLGIVLFAGLMSLSRGGIVAIATASLVVGVIYYLTALVGRRALAGVAALVLVLGVSLCIYGYDQVAGRLDDFTAMSLDELDQHSSRRNLWAANWTSFCSSPWLGRGVGAHREFYKIFMPNRLEVEFTHAENGYVQIASEAGLGGIALLLVGIGMLGHWCVSTFRHTRCPQIMAALGAVAAGLATSIVHSAADFVWYIPATMSWTVMLAAIACRLSQMAHLDDASEDKRLCLPRGAWIAISALAAVVGAWMVHERLQPALASQHWDSYLKRSQLLASLDSDQAVQLAAGQQSAGVPSRQELVDVMTADLEAYARRHADYGRVHIRLAAAYLRKFQHHQRFSKNPLDLAQIRDAAIASQFPSRQALNEWLQRAIGEHYVYLDRALWHARRGLRLCPVQGEAYIYLAELCFLEGAPASAKSAYLEQALKVRPHDGQVLFMAGKEAAAAGDLPKAIDYWQRSFHSGPRHQRQLATLLAGPGRLPVAFFLEKFQPNLKDWLPLLTRYRELGQPDELRQLCEYFVALADNDPAWRSNPRSGRMWLAMHHTYRGAGDHGAADACIKKSIDAAPHDFAARFALAGWLMQTDNFVEAEQQLRWCARRRPANRNVQNMLQRAVRRRVAVTNYTTAGKDDPQKALPR